jgi:hypothetical protein
VAAAADGQVRAVVRRLVRKHLPAPSERPAACRPIARCPTCRRSACCRSTRRAPTSRRGSGCRANPAAVAAAVLGGHVRRFDLLRNDGGSLTLDGALLGRRRRHGPRGPVPAAINVDDAELSSGREQLLAAVVANAAGYSAFDGPPAVGGSAAHRRRSRRRRRARRPSASARRGRGPARTRPRGRGDAGRGPPVPRRRRGGTLTRKRTWWMERAAWGVYVPE